MCCRSSAFLINNPRHGRKKTSSSLFFSLSLVKKEKKKMRDSEMVFFFFFFSLLTGSVERLRIGLSLSYVYSRPLYIYTNIKRYRTQTVDFPTPSFPYSSQTVWGFVIFPSDCININIFSIYFMDGIFSVSFFYFLFFYFLYFNGQPAISSHPPPLPIQ
jgi:hypothetical protein